MRTLSPPTGQPAVMSVTIDERAEERPPRRRRRPPACTRGRCRPAPPRRPGRRGRDRRSRERSRRRARALPTRRRRTPVVKLWACPRISSELVDALEPATPHTRSLDALLTLASAPNERSGAVARLPLNSASAVRPRQSCRSVHRPGARPVSQGGAGFGVTNRPTRTRRGAGSGQRERGLTGYVCLGERRAGGGRAGRSGLVDAGLGAGCRARG